MYVDLEVEDIERCKCWSVPMARLSVVWAFGELAIILAIMDEHSGCPMPGFTDSQVSYARLLTSHRAKSTCGG